MSLARIREFSFSVICILAIAIATVAPALAQNECNLLAPPTVTTGSISGADTDQTGRLNRDGRGSTCEFLRPPPAPFAGAIDADAYTFTNTSAGPICVFVDLDAIGCGVATNQISMAAYLGSYVPTAPTTNLIGDPGLSTGQNFSTSMNFTVPAGVTYVIVVHNVNAATTCPSYTFTRTETNSCRDPGFDLANDGSADLALFRPSGGLATWHTLTVPGGSSATFQLGSAGDIPADGDYTGDETSDPAVFRPNNGTWYTSTDPSTNYGARLWGASGDIPVPGDYDRDGITDLAVYRPSTARYFILRSSTNSFYEVQHGITGDVPVPADYDGDGKMDVAIWRPSNGVWQWRTSAGNFGTYNQITWGVSGDTPAPADYDGDGKADISVYRPSQGVWYMLRSSIAAGAGQPTAVGFGIAGDVPQPADYDGDRKADQAVYRPSNGSWWINRSGGSGVFATTFGQAGDIPTTSQNPHLP